MKKLIIVLMIAISLSACAATKPIDTKSCIAVANTVENNEATSGNQVYKNCVDKQQQKNEAKKGFWEKTAEGALFLILDVLSS